MSRARPGPGCHDLDLLACLPLTDAAEAALEDYARVLTRASAAEAVGDEQGVTAVHVCGAPAPAEDGVADLRAFAGELAAREQEGGLGWQ